MKAGITAEGRDLNAAVGARYGLSRFLIIADTETGEITAVPNKRNNADTQAGIKMVILAIGNGVDIVITGYLSPTAEKYLTQNKIKVISGFKGSAADALKKIQEQEAANQSFSSPAKGEAAKTGFLPSLTKSFRQLGSMLPVMLGVILLIGLFKTFLTRDIISELFPGSALPDAFFGTCIGSLLAGNSINSYIIGQELLDRGVTLFGVTGFMTAWVAVGLVQLPAEISALGKRFALSRNLLSFIICIAVSLLTAGSFYLIRG
jgi:predicted Fe-Mo cluster-binding NifX family protein